MFKIGEFARLASVSVRLLHHYGELGLLLPQYIDPDSGYRYYSLDQLPRLHRILALKDLGLSLTQITYLLQDAVSHDEIRGMLLRKRAELREVVEIEQARLRRVEARLTQIDQAADLPQADIVLKSVEPLHVLSLRKALPAQTSPRYLFYEIGHALREAGLRQHTQAILCLYHTRYLIERFAGLTPKRYLIEAAYAIPAENIDTLPSVNGRRLRTSILPGYALVATCIHCGPDEVRHQAVAPALRWIDAHGYGLAGPTREIYLQRGDPDHPQDNITELQWPIIPSVRMPPHEGSG